MTQVWVLSLPSMTCPEGGLYKPIKALKSVPGPIACIRETASSVTATLKVATCTMMSRNPCDIHLKPIEKAEKYLMRIVWSDVRTY